MRPTLLVFLCALNACGAENFGHTDDGAPTDEGPRTSTAPQSPLAFWPEADPLLVQGIPRAVGRITELFAHRVDMNRFYYEEATRSMGFFYDWQVPPSSVRLAMAQPLGLELAVHGEAHFIRRFTDGDDPPYEVNVMAWAKCSDDNRRELQRRLQDNCNRLAQLARGAARSHDYFGTLVGGPRFIKEDGGIFDTHKEFEQACRITRRTTEACADSHGTVENPNCVYVTEATTATVDGTLPCQVDPGSPTRPATTAPP